MPKRHVLALAPCLAAVLACGPRPTPTGGPPAAPTPSAPAPVPADLRLESLGENARVAGFTTKSLYLDGAEKPIGARFTHDATGYVFDYLRIESAPQAFLWVNSLPTSDMGEPHTQEHLLLGKGDQGRRLGSTETMALGESSAFTSQWFTAYHFHTVAGPDAFWTLFDAQLDAQIDPDYSDEEIRREVAHFGTAVLPDGSLRLEEKGTVYNEMVRTFEQPGVSGWHEVGRLLYGPEHPLAYSSGGVPADIRRMTAKDIRTFHAQNYHLANMGMIGAFPSSMPLASVLERTAAILGEHAARKGPVRSMRDAPPPVPAKVGSIAITEYPYQDAQAPGSLLLAWPATRQLDVTEQTLLELFLASVAGDESTNFYKVFIDSKTRKLDIGATSVWGSLSHDQGMPLYVGFEQVAGAHLDEAGARKVREAVAAELARIAALPAGDAELAALNERVRSRLIELRRRLAKVLNTPPGFGFRGAGDEWMQHLLTLERLPTFQKSLTFAPQLVQIEALLAGGKENLWKDRLPKWGLAETPYVVVARPSTAERERLDRERAGRLAAETARVTKVYGAKDASEALGRFAKEYDATTKELEASARATPMPPLVSSLPMTLDDGLDYHVHEVSGVPAVSSTFPGTTAGTVGVAFRLDGVPAELQPYLYLLPVLLTQSGLVIDGQPVPADEVLERQRREVLGVNATVQSDTRTGRVELVLTGSGIDAEETKRAIGWMVRSLTAPDWRPANLARLRDLADRHAQELRTLMQGPEEYWVQDPRDAYLLQRSSVYAHGESRLTAAHDVHRLRWMLLDPGNKKVADEAARFLERLAIAPSALRDRATLIGLARALAGAPAKRDAKTVKWLPTASTAKATRDLLKEAGKDLSVLVPDLPDGSLASDWAYLCRQMAADLRAGAPATLARLEQLRTTVVRKAHARLHVVGSAETQQAIAHEIDALVGALGGDPALARVPDGPRFVDDRLLSRQPGATRPVYLGLVNPATQSGVFVHTAPAPGYLDTSEDALLDYLASNLYTGHGAHSLFMKTWAAGLAYSNGIRVGLRQARVDYYAERCPELPQTLRFVIGELTRSEPDKSIASYALAGAFSSRVAASYESRGQSIANDLADGLPPEKIRRFREALIQISQRNDLLPELVARFPRVYARVLPGYSQGWAPVANAVYMVVGPDGQLDAWQKYLSSTVAADAKLWKLYPRDFWIPATLR